MSTRGYTPAILAEVGLLPINVGLAITCLYLLVDVKSGQQRSRQRTALAIFTALLNLLALSSAITDSVFFVNYVHRVTSDCMNTSSHLRELFRNQMLPETLPIILWCVEGFMFWRACVHLRSFSQFLLGVCVASLAAISIWSGSIILVNKFTAAKSFEEAYHLITITTAAITFLITLAIACQMILAARADDSMPLARIFVESGAPLTLNAILAALFYSIRAWMSFAVIIMPQIAILTALLIIYRIANGEEGVIRLEDSPGRRSVNLPQSSP